MHARVITVQVRSGQEDEVARVIRESILQAARNQKGYRGWITLLDRATGKAINISLWETEEDLRAGEASGYFQEQAAKSAPHAAGPPSREAFEVVVADLPEA